MIENLIHINDQKLLFVMAADAEYGAHLQQRFKPLMTGIGPVEAAVVLTRTLAELRLADELPDFVISLGSAGSRDLEQTEVYQASSVSYRDMDASAFGFEKGQTPFLDLPIEVPLGLNIPGLRQARLSTGANVVSGEQYSTLAAEMVDMETFAVLRACQSFNLPLIGLRGISDGKEDVNHVDDWKAYLHIVDQKLADAVDLVISTIRQGVI